MYSPKIDEELIPTIHMIAQAINKPMTYVVNTIIRSALIIAPFMLGGALLNQDNKNGKLTNPKDKELKNGQASNTTV